ncbi:ecotin [Chimaeribacter arupi]|uniref:Ecotin n=2 Tax=Yersiniaceae TaxID=1903411 RepID=A0A2N5EMK4_9GAMM|nr:MULTISPECIES: serine protease inhibitor ecotin [Yersiniaceae]MBS0968619.1 serine protease inhibitor ecotin [Nissabacter archeti]MDV5139759.1 serine protease inhibitor ecotin [Chimaeribacter arupi]PLR46649.1 ecotin [Chimaeribacter arupi]PLR49300.1 ecotin [Chimaeribacter arupi]PLR52836.1 ecotin [Chimaeribacter arupi]
MTRTSPLAICLLMTASCLSASAFAQQPPLKNIAPYPQPEKGISRQVIQLPERKNEYLYKIELMIGQTLETDCNQHHLLGQLRSETVDGWGYPYYVYEPAKTPDSGMMHVSTMMACPEGKKEKKFVDANLGANGMLRYNSKLPVVVYTPGNIEVKYRIWKAEDNISSAKIE